MSQHDFVIANGSGAAVRSDLNDALAALVSQSSGTAAPSTTYSYQLWADTTNNLLKIRNSANSAWVTLMSLASATTLDLYSNGSKAIEVDASQNAKFSSTGAVRTPVGTTAQRPTAVQGHIRFNTTTSQFEGYDGTAWGAIGGAGNGKLDTFSGNGSTVAFTLTTDPGSENNTIVSISGVLQHKSAYSISGTTLTFSTAPPTGTNNIEVMYNTALSVGTPSDATVGIAKLSASGTPSSTTFLRGDNTWAAPTAGAWVLIKTVTAAAAATVDFVNGSGGVVLDSTYKAYAIALSGISPATDAVELLFRTSTNAGSSYDSGAGNYGRFRISGDSSGNTVTGGGTTETAISLGGSLGNAAGETCSGVIYLFNPSAASPFLMQFHITYIDSAGNLATRYGGGARLTSADVDAVRLLMSSGNMSGTAILYGLKDS